MSARVPLFYLYRQRLPAAAPQALQIVSTCHALAMAGAEVTLLADRPVGGQAFGDRAPAIAGDPQRATAVLEAYGLDPHARLHLHWLTFRHRTLAGLEYRARLVRALRECHARGLIPVVFSRRADYAADLLRWRRHLRLPVKLLYEWHYVASANAMEAGDPVRAARLARDEAIVLAEAEGHITVSRALQSYLEQHSPPAAPVLVVPNGGPEVGGRTAGSSGAGGTSTGPSGAPGFDDKVRVVYAGLFRRPSDLSGLLEAVQHLPEGIDVDIIGGDEEGRWLAEVRVAASAAGLERRVRFTGPLTAADTRQALQRATVAVATFADTLDRRHFGCPLKLLEYHAAGTPLVSTDHPTVRELVTHEVDGLLVPPGDPIALARAVRRLAEDPALRTRLARNGLEIAATRTWRIRGTRLLEFIREQVLRS